MGIVFMIIIRANRYAGSTATKGEIQYDDSYLDRSICRYGSEHRYEGVYPGQTLRSLYEAYHRTDLSVYVDRFVPICRSTYYGYHHFCVAVV
jgi:hypothetical protein